MADLEAYLKMFASNRSYRNGSENTSSSSADRGIRPSSQETRRLLKYVLPYRGAMFIAVISLVVGSILGLIFPWIMQNLVNSVFGQNSHAELNRITAILIGTFLLRSFFYYFQVYYLSFIGERIVVDLRLQTYEKLQGLSIRFFTNRRTGELLSRLSSDITLIRAALTNNIATVLSQAITFAGSLALMLILNWRLTIFIMLLAPAVAAAGIVFGARLRKLSTQVQDELAGSAALAEEALSNNRIVKAFTRERYEVKRYAEQTERTFQVTMQMNIVRSAFGPLITFLAFSSLAAILWFGGREVIAGRLSAGALIAFLVYGINIAASIGAFSNLYTQLQEAAGATRRIFEIIDEQPEIFDLPEAIHLPPVSGRIRFNKVSFAYPNGVPNSEDNGSGIGIHDHVLCNIELEVQPGEILALVGPSGAGKSTLFNLIPRFYDPTEGSITIDGMDIRQVSIISLRSQIGIVPQETQLFSGTIRENLRYGRLDASDADIEAAADAANAVEFIHAFPEGYDTLVGERGVKLSGGQRQRIAIARAILKNPRILLLDEATSSLDSESEQLVQEALERLMQGRTSIVIAHRLSTIQHAGRIAVLEDGQIVEFGNHSELLALGGLYSRLHRLQFGVTNSKPLF